MNTHTPGPWVLKHISGSNFAVQRFEIRSGSGMPHPIFNKDISAIDGTTVCMSPQDANLIAAAPDLFESQTMGAQMNTPDFLDWMADRLIHVYGESPDVDFVLSLRSRANAGRRAIAKARGENND